MAAPTASRVTGTAQDAWAGWSDVEAGLKDWTEAQLDACSAGLGQIAAAQQAALSLWIGMVEASARAWYAGAACSPGPTLAATFADAWSPWLPCLQRGGEQLG